MRKITFTFLLVSIFATATFCAAQNTSAKRPMTFEDMMKMKRLGETAVSPDGKWLAYSVTTVDLARNTKTPELWMQAIAGGDPHPFTVGQPGDGSPQFSSDGHSVLFLSGREGGQQIWLADFDSATGVTSNPRKLTSIATEADNAQWSPDGKSIVFTSAVYPDCAAITTADFDTGNKCNADRDKATSDSPVKAQIFTHLLYRHWNHYTGDKRSASYFLSPLRAAPCATSRPTIRTTYHAVFASKGGGGFAISPDSKELAFTRTSIQSRRRV